ncbi:methyl-accepting chemotaxis protein [Desulfobotulus sp. H1]|uniref:Methyl-accepting chemotaxis protein n=1 Tax=Desulfobotulus pelophilus TaxID=2823377 RepID=A0ABT3NBW0_9BACT|nr:methyl-accepting chemotaxis protein [Desulfobotulus pelophilus]MCW7754442.1 methyl-accepting chemotaxis protein [Desulfobotulus pelophilus]
MFSTMRLKTKMLFAVCSVAVLAFTVTIWTISHMASGQLREAAENIATEAAHRHGGEVRAQLEEPLNAAETMAQILGGGQSSGMLHSRKMVTALMRGVLAENPQFWGAWAVWHPNAFDKKDAEFRNTDGSDETGQFMPYWHRSSGTPELDITGAYAEDSPDGQWYWQPYRTGKIFITPPTEYEIAGKMTMLVSACVPIRANGRIVGVAGVDYSMDRMGEIIAAVQPFGADHSYGFLVSNDGIGVAHPQDKAIGAHMRDFGVDEAIIRSVAEGRPVRELGRSAIFGGNSFTVYAPIQIGRSEAPWSLAVVVSMDKVLEGSRYLRNASMGIGVFSVILLFVVVYGIADRIIVRPIQHVASNLREISEGEGDLTRRLPVSGKDEIAFLSQNFNTFITNLQTMIARIQKNATTLNQSSSGLTTIAARMATETAGTAENAKKVTAASRQMTTNIHTVAAAMEEASTNINMVATATEEMTSTITEIAINSEKARTISEKAVVTGKTASERMWALEEAARKISTVTETITEISEQTNLLALNATIEAARAGDAGKGFAVVAGEIKELSRQTAKATREIRERIEGIQGLSEETIVAIGDVVRVIGDISDINATIATAVEEQTAATREIAGNISQASAGAQEVNANVSQLSVAAAEISSDISAVNSKTDNLRKEGKEVTSSADELARLGADLSELTGRFNV